MSIGSALRYPPSGDPYLVQLVSVLNAELVRREPTLVGWKQVGSTLTVRFRAALASPWVRAHVQSTETGEGGTSYDPSNFRTSAEIDCREDRLQETTVTGISPNEHYVIFLVPVQEDGTGTKILYDGEGGRPDNMAFVSIEADPVA